MYTLWSFCKNRYADTDLKAQAGAMPAEMRHSLTQKIVQTLDDDGEGNNGTDGEGNDATVAGENVEAILERVELDLTKANQQLATLEEKEEFISVRIRKYQEMLKKQDGHLKDLQERQQQQQNDNDDNVQEGDGDQEISTASKEQQQQHYEEQVAKQQKHKDALGKVVDIHMDILKHVKDCTRTIATLEQKKYELTRMTQKCREFLVMAEEAEREQQLGIIVDGEDADDLALMEIAPLNNTAAGDKNSAPDQQNTAAGQVAPLIDEEAVGSVVEESGDSGDTPASTATTTTQKEEVLAKSDANRETRTLEVPAARGDEMAVVPTDVEPEELEASAA